MTGAAVNLKNIFIALGIAAGLLALTVEISTIFNHQVPFHFIAGHSSAMTLAIILTWFLFGLCLFFWPRSLNNAFRLAGAALVVISLARAVYYPLIYAREFGAVTPLVNIPTGIFLLLIAGLTGPEPSKILIRNGHSMTKSSILAMCGDHYSSLFTFYFTNVQVASVFGMFNTGAESGLFTFYTHGRLSQQLAYSISWLVFAIILLIYRHPLEVDTDPLGSSCSPCAYGAESLY